MTKDETESKLLEWLELVAAGTYKPSEMIANFKDIYTDLNREVKSRREQLLDINQWSQLLLSNRAKGLRDRVLWAMIADINNRTTD